MSRLKLGLLPGGGRGGVRGGGREGRGRGQGRFLGLGGFLIVLMLLQMVPIPMPLTLAQPQSAVFTFMHHGILFTLAPDSISAQYGDEKLTLKFATNKKTLDQCTITPASNGYLMDYGNVQIKVTVPQNKPIIKLTFSGSGVDANQFKVKIFSEDVKTKLIKPLKQEGEKVKGNYLKFDWSDAKNYSKSFMGDTLSFSVSGPFDIDPELGVDEGSYQIPFVLWAPNFNTGESYGAIGSGTIAEEWSYSIVQPSGAGFFGTAQASSSGGVLVSYSWACSAVYPPQTQNFGATTTISKTFNYASPVNLTFNIKVEGGGNNNGYDAYGYLKVYDGAGAVIYQFGWEYHGGQVSYTSQTTATLTNLTSFKVELWTYAFALGSASSYGWARVSLSQMAVLSPTTNTTINYYANSTGSYYNATVQNSIGNAYLLLPKGTSVTNVSANYTTLPGWSYRKAHTINPAAGAGTGYQVRIIVHYGSGTDSGEHVYLNGHCRADFGDVRFTKADGKTLLSYWMESKTDSDNAVFWVKIDDDLSANPVTIYIYYGNPTATTTSNGKNTFVFFDDFQSYAVDSDINGQGGWVTKRIGGTGEAKIRLYNNIKHLHLYSTDAGTAIVHPVDTSNAGYVLMAKVTAVDWNEAVSIAFSDDAVTAYGNVYNGYEYVMVGWAGATSKIRKWVNGASTDLASMSDGAANNVYYTIMLSWFGSTLKAWRDGSVKMQASDTTFASRNYIHLDTWSGSDWYFKWVIIRKFVDPEPAHGSWGSEEPTAASQSTNYILLPFNSTHWILRTPDQLTAGATTIALIKWNATNAVYDLSVSPTTIRPDQVLTVNATLKDPLGNPLNEAVNCTILDAQGIVYNYTTGTATNGLAVLTIQVPHQNGKYYAQVNVITGEYKGVLAVPFTVSDAFTIFFVSESPNTYYKQPGTVVNITVKLLYNADGSPASGLLVKLTDVNGTVLDTDCTDSNGYVTLSGVVNQTAELEWYITGYTDQSSATYVYTGYGNAIYNTITISGDLQALEITCNTTLMDGLVVQHAFGFYIAGEGEGSYKLPCYINYSGIRIPYLVISDTSLVLGQNLIVTARIENYNPSPVDDVQLVITLVTPLGDTVDTITFAVGTIKPANYVMAQATKTFTPQWSGPYLWLYNFTSSTINFNGSGSLFPIIVTSNPVYIKDMAYISDVWDPVYKYTWTQPNAVPGDYVYVQVMDANKLTSCNFTKIEVPSRRECVLTVSAYPYVVESGMNFTVCANVSFNTPPPYYAITIAGEGITHTVYNQNATWVITAPVKPMFALSTLYYDVAVKDANGMEYASTRLPIDVFNYPPKVYLNSPVEGAVVSNVTTFDLDVQDDSGIREVLWRIDDGAWQNLTAPYDFSYDTAKLGDGRHILYVKATDNAGFVQIAQFYFYSQNLAEQWKFESVFKSILSTAANISFPVLLGFGVVALVLGYALAKIKQKKPQPPIVVQIEQKTKEKKEGKK